MNRSSHSNQEPRVSGAVSVFLPTTGHRKTANVLFTSARRASASNVHERRYAEMVSPASAALLFSCSHSPLLIRMVMLAHFLLLSASVRKAGNHIRVLMPFLNTSMGLLSNRRFRIASLRPAGGASLPTGCRVFNFTLSRGWLVTAMRAKRICITECCNIVGKFVVIQCLPEVPRSGDMSEARRPAKFVEDDEGGVQSRNRDSAPLLPVFAAVCCMDSRIRATHGLGR